MNKFVLESTKNTPEIIFDGENNRFSVTGISTPVNAFEFYQKVVEWINANESSFPDDAVFKFNMPYFNSATMKAVMMLFERIREANRAGKKWLVDWFVEEDDEFMLDAAETFQSVLEMEFRISS